MRTSVGVNVRHSTSPRRCSCSLQAQRLIRRLKVHLLRSEHGRSEDGRSRRPRSKGARRERPAGALLTISLRGESFRDSQKSRRNASPATNYGRKSATAHAQTFPELFDGSQVCQADGPTIASKRFYVVFGGLRCDRASSVRVRHGTSRRGAQRCAGERRSTK